MIEVNNLTKKFGSLTAVNNLSFKVNKGEVLGFLGPNGAGKSTTMRMITCFLMPTSGTVTVNGYDILSNSVDVRKHIGYLPENAPAYPDMSVEAFLAFVAEMREYSGRELKKKVNETIEKCFLKSVRYQTIDTLSKGYKQRVCFAQAILHDPPVLIFDEPTDGLDPNQKHEVRQLIKKMGEEKCVILSTHILEEVDSVCSRAIIISKGQIVVDGTPEKLRAMSKLHGAVTISLSGVGEDVAIPFMASLPNVYHAEKIGEKGDAIVYRIYPKENKSIAHHVASAIREKEWEVEEFKIEEGRLEEVFRKVTT